MPEYSLSTFHLTAKKDKEIWVRFGDADAFYFRQKELEEKDIRYVHDLKSLIIVKLQSFLKDYSEMDIRLFKGNDILKSYTPIVDLFNTGEEALNITIVREKGMYKMVASEYFKVYIPNS